MMQVSLFNCDVGKSEKYQAFRIILGRSRNTSLTTVNGLRFALTTRSVLSKDLNGDVTFATTDALTINSRYYLVSLSGPAASKCLYRNVISQLINNEKWMRSPRTRSISNFLSEPNFRKALRQIKYCRIKMSCKIILSQHALQNVKIKFRILKQYSYTRFLY